MEPCQILYTEEYKSTMDALNQSLLKKEYSEEALQLTEDALSLLASHYTTWNYRLDIVKAIGADLFEELDWCEYVALENEKNYQIWNYRQRIIELIVQDPKTKDRFDVKREYPILHAMLTQDSKNHHVWTYRKWFVGRFALFQYPPELAFVDKLLDEDARNNSAWTHRFYLKFKDPEFSLDSVELEIQYVKLKIDICPQNPSSWNYLKGIYTHCSYSLTELKSFCVTYGDWKNGNVASTFALEMLAKIAIEEGNRPEAIEIYLNLGVKYDPIRKHYWANLKQKLE